MAVLIHQRVSKKGWPRQQQSAQNIFAQVSLQSGRWPCCTECIRRAPWLSPKQPVSSSRTFNCTVRKYHLATALPYLIVPSGHQLICRNKTKSKATFQASVELQLVASCSCGRQIRKNLAGGRQCTTTWPHVSPILELDNYIPNWNWSIWCRGKACDKSHQARKGQNTNFVRSRAFVVSATQTHRYPQVVLGNRFRRFCCHFLTYCPSLQSGQCLALA